MGKSSKQKKNKVPKITEEEYVAYLSNLKASDGKLPLPEKAERIEKN